MKIKALFLVLLVCSLSWGEQPCCCCREISKWLSKNINKIEKLTEAPVNSTLWWVHMQRAFWHIDKKEYEMAAEALFDAIKRNPGDPMAYDLLSSVLVSLGREKEAWMAKVIARLLGA